MNAQKIIKVDSSEKVQDSLLTATDLSHSFDYKLFEDVDISLFPTDSIAVLGVSGSGKSTLLHILSTLLKPEHGKVILLGKDIYSLDSKELLNIRRNDVGIIFQSHYLFKGFSVKENLEISSIISSNKIDYDLLDKLKITSTLSQNVSELSGGQQQRISIARVMLKKPKLIFADEPTGNLDKETANDVMDVLLDYAKQNNAALFIVTHDEKIAQRCDKMYRLLDKKLVSIS